jgi:hypothetical protein
LLRRAMAGSESPGPFVTPVVVRQQETPSQK